MKPIVELIQYNLNNNIISLPETFNNLYSYLTSSNKNVEKLIAERVAHGEIKDIQQAKKKHCWSCIFKFNYMVFFKK